MRVDVTSNPVLHPNALPAARPAATAESLLELGEPFAEFDDRWHVLRVNAKFAQKLGRTRETLLGRPFWSLLPPAVALDGPGALALRRCQAVRETVVFEDPVLPFGAWSAISAHPTDGGGVVVFARDITARKRAEDALRESRDTLRQAEERLRAIVMHLPSGLILADLDAQTHQWNAHALAIHRHAPGDDEARFLASLLAVHDLCTLDGDALPADGWPLPRLMAGESFLDEEVRVRNVRLGWERIFSYSAVVVPGTRPRTGLLAVTDVTDRKRAELHMRDEERRRIEFLAVLSHELRNPMAPLRNALAVLDRVDPTGAQALRARAIATRQLEQMARLTDDLLDVTRIARGKIDLVRSDVDLGGLVRCVADEHRERVRRRGLSFAVLVPASPLFVHADEARIAQVVTNLLQNAARFTPAGGRVAVAVVEEGHWAVVRVSDTGRGVEHALLDAMFEPFVQAPQALARSEGGLGLGLALVRGLVLLHGGEVSAASEGSGHGAEFTVRLPCIGAIDAGPQRPGMAIS